MPKITTTPRIVRSRLSGLNWNHDKFGLKPDDLHTTLFDEFNTFQGSLQSPIAFYHDVLEISKKAKNIDELHHMLRQRQLFRTEELNEAAESVFTHLAWSRSQHACEHSDRQNLALSLLISRSLDTVVGYVDSFLREDYKQRHRRCTPEDPYDIKPTSSSAFQSAGDPGEPLDPVGSSKGVGEKTQQRSSSRTGTTGPDPSQCSGGSHYQTSKSQRMNSRRFAQKQSEAGAKKKTLRPSSLRRGTTTSETAQRSDESGQQTSESRRVRGRNGGGKKSESEARKITKSTALHVGATGATLDRCSEGFRHQPSRQVKGGKSAETQRETGVLSETRSQLSPTDAPKRKRKAAGEDNRTAQNLQEARSSKRARRSPRLASTGVVRLVDPNRPAKRQALEESKPKGRKRIKLASEELDEDSSVTSHGNVLPEPNFDFPDWAIEMAEGSDGDAFHDWMIDDV